jgi:hypothetical protein
MKEIITAIILFAISFFAFVLSVRSFMEKGFLFNNAYIYASKQEREKMNKKPHYRQSAIVFLLIGLIFLLNALAVLIKANWIFYIANTKSSVRRKHRMSRFLLLSLLY